ncbi:MAG: hypothetical protein ACI93P_000851 [bacterium]|jgi:hypothetical protein
MKNKLFLIFGTRLQPEKLFYLIPIVELVKRDYNICFLNITPLFPSIPQEFKLKKVHEDTVTYKDIKNLSEIEQLLRKFERKNIVALEGGWRLKEQRKVIVYLKKRSVFTISLNILPTNKPNYFAILTNFIKNSFVTHRDYADAIIVDGAYKRKYFESLGYKNIWSLHSHIFEEFLNRKCVPLLTENQDFILYVDQNFSGHPDFEWFKIPKGSFNDFYGELDVFLKNLSLEYNLPVKIALHPTSDEEIYKDFFPKFEFSKNDTFKLMNNSKFIVGHYSGALDFAILLKKKILLIAISDKISSKIADNQLIFANKTGVTNINLPFRAKHFYFKDVTSERYINSFIKETNSPEHSFASLFFNKLNKNAIG